MLKTSMKVLLGASALAVVAAVSLTAPAHAQGQPGTMSAAPPPAGPYGYPPVAQQPAYPYPPQQNALVPSDGSGTGGGITQEANPRYPGPKIN